jgi:putative ABC transport system permease protein
MTLFEANSRLKEISIRKVLGASLGNLFSMLAKAHFKSILIAGFISIPIIYICASNWLTAYPARIEITLWYFLLPLVVMIALVVLTSGFQITKAANSNPVHYLKND